MSATNDMEQQQRQRWNTYASNVDGLQSYESFLAQPGKRQIHALYRRQVRGKTILEVGCGAGHMITSLTQDDPGREITGLDLSAEMLKLAAARGCRSLVCGSGNELPFAENSFETVIAAAWVFRYLNPEQALKEVWRVLRPGGDFMFDIPLLCGTALEACAEAVRTPWRWRRAFQRPRLDLNPLSAQIWTKRLRTSGFTVVRTVGILELPFLSQRLHWAPLIENRFLQHGCLTLFHHARKP